MGGLGWLHMDSDACINLCFFYSMPWGIRILLSISSYLVLGYFWVAGLLVFQMFVLPTGMGGYGLSIASTTSSSNENSLGITALEIEWWHKTTLLVRRTCGKLRYQK